MCGDLDEADEAQAQAFGHFLMRVRPLVRHRKLRPAAPPAAGDVDLPGYMNGLFGELLTACVEDAEQAVTKEKLALVGAQAVVLARLAGLLAGSAASSGEPLR